jgi:hypothetical protein
MGIDFYLTDFVRLRNTLCGAKHLRSAKKPIIVIVMIIVNIIVVLDNPKTSNVAIICIFSFKSR